VGFAIPSNIVARVVPALIAKVQFQWPWLGVTGGDVTPRLAEANGLPLNNRGAYISGVTKARLVSSDDRQTHPEIPWQAIIEMRHHPLMDPVLGHLFVIQPNPQSRLRGQL